MNEPMGELRRDQYGVMWVKVQPRSVYDLSMPMTGVVWALPVLETGAANDDAL